MLNKVILMGRFTKDPELRSTPQSVSVCNFRLAVMRNYKNGGNYESDFIDCVAWRSSAEFVDKYFSKGRMAVVEGRLQIRDWTDKEGNKRRSAEVIVTSIYFGDSKKDGDSAPGSYRPAGAPINVSASDFSDIEDDGELPF